MLQNLRLEIWKHTDQTGESQGKIGLKAGIVESRLSLIIRGRVEPAPEERKALAQVLDVDEAILFDEREQPCSAKG